MTSLNFNGILAAQIENFIDLRRISGTDYDSQARLLGYFDRFLVEQGLTEPIITRQMIDGYQESLSYLAPRSQGNRFSVVHQFCEYLAKN